MNEHDLTTLDGTISAVWALLRAGTTGTGGAARFVTLATSGVRGGEARIVVLRGFDETANQLEFHTDARSQKIAEIAQNPNATLLAWDADRQFQIRLRCELRLAASDYTDARWENVPHPSRRGYASLPAPGSGISAPEALKIAPKRENFVVVHARIAEIETLLLDPDLQRRALFVRGSAFQGHWLAP